jgi:3(or 17)beta-hydroxysteroid dehydrogenase
MNTASAGALAGKVAIVTGGASGIGAATVRRLRTEGALVVTTDVQTELGRQVADEAGATFLEQDVSDADSWAPVVDAALGHGRLDIIVNNAGTTGRGSIEDVDLETWHHILGINLTGVMLGCKHAVAAMRQNPDGPSGSIINIASTTAFTAVPGDVAYVASKGGVRSLTKSVATWCGHQRLNIRCNAIIPGATDTGIIERASQRMPGVRDHLAGISPLGRMGTPEDIAGAVVFLAGPDSAFITGSDLFVDGGALAVHPGY